MVPWLRTVLIGLAILVLGVFAYVGYNSYAVGRRPASDEAYTGANINPPAEGKPAAGGGFGFPRTSVTGVDPSGAPEVTARGEPAPPTAWWRRLPTAWRQTHRMA